MEKIIEPCSCPLAGYCDRHKGTSKEKKTKFLHKLCQTNDKYRKSWDEEAKRAAEKGIIKYYKEPKKTQKQLLHEFSPEDLEWMNKIKEERERKNMGGLKKERAEKQEKIVKQAKKIINNAQNKKSKGLGDDVAKALAAIGITPELMEKIMGGDCGCIKKKNKLNELFPYKEKNKEEIVGTSETIEPPTN